MDRHDRLDAAVELIVLERVVKHHGDQTGLPVMAVDNVRAEIKRREHREDRLAEEGKLLDILVDVAVRMAARKIKLVVHKVEGHALILQLEQTDILASPGKVHGEVRDELHLILVLLRDRHVFRQDHAHVKLVFVDVLRQRADDIRQTSCLDKRYTFRSRKQNLFHTKPPSIVSCSFPAIWQVLSLPCYAASMRGSYAASPAPAFPARWPSPSR